MAFGSDTGKHINYGVFVVEQDTSNKHILLWGKSTAMTPDDGLTLNFDGYVQKITVMGTVQWMSYLSSRYENDEYVAGVVQTGAAVFAYYHSNHGTVAYRTSAICKLSYLNGNLIYSKAIIYQDYMFTPPEIIYRESAFYLDLDPYPTLDNTNYNQIVATSVL